MKSIKKILILCNAHDCLRHEIPNQIMIKQLYVTVFLLKKIIDDQFSLDLNNQGAIGFDSFFRPGHQLSSFLNGYTIQKSWQDIDMSLYDLIITHPDYQSEIRDHLLERYKIKNKSRVYSFTELQIPSLKIYKTAASLFGEKGALPFDRNSTNEADLSKFKQEFDSSFNRISIDEQESIIPNLNHFVKGNNARLRTKKIQKVLILDDYKRPFFIGDSVYWLAKIRKLTTVISDEVEYCLNIDNSSVFKFVYNAYQKSLPDNIKFTNDNWRQISFDDYDLILCNNDILFKFYYHVNLYSKQSLDKLLLYSFSVMDERPITKKVTTDFYSNMYRSFSSNKIHKKINATINHELSLLQNEHLWATNWAKKNNLRRSDRLIVLLHDASNPEKVIYDLTLYTLIRKFIQLDDNIKIVLVTEKKISSHIWLSSVISALDNSKVVRVNNLPLRKVMRLFTDRRVDAVIGPCTGLMHLADAIYSHLSSCQIINKVPILLTYAGKQPPERRYHPNYWWKNSNNVSCVLHMKDSYETDKTDLFMLAECPDDFEEFNRRAVSAKHIDGHSLFNFIIEKFPAFVNKYRFPEKNKPEFGSSDLQTSPNKIPTFIISLDHRKERRKHIIEQFEDKDAFDWTLVKAIENEYGNLGLWLTMQKIVAESVSLNREYVLICEDDHQFTSDFTEPHLYACIENAKILNADLLLGGICSTDNNFKQVQQNLIAVEHFACTQFVIIFKSFFDVILNSAFLDNDCVDLKMAVLTSKKLTVYPFISTQKDFGYSDCSSGYYESKMTSFFKETSRLINRKIHS